MNNLSSFILPAVIGLFTGIGHGFVSEKLDLPQSLAEQIVPTTQVQSMNN